MLGRRHLLGGSLRLETPATTPKVCLEILSSSKNLKDTGKNCLEDPFETGFISSIK